MHKLALASLFLVLVVAGPGARASQVRVPVNSATSTLNVQLCADPGGLGTQCDNDTSPISGYLTVALDHNGNPTQIAFRDFDLMATETMVLELRWLFGLAGVDVDVQNMRIYHPRPGVTNAFTPVVGGAFTFPLVPLRASGNAHYDLRDLACGVAPVPCSSNIDLATLGEADIENLSGTVQVVNGVVSVYLDITFSAPLDESNPALGTLTGRAIVNASAPISQSLVPRGSDWKYLDDGSNQGDLYIHLPPFFDDSQWPLGVAQLGYGDGDEQAVVRYGPDGANKYITTYFRHSFNVVDPFDYTNLALRVLADDGVIVYLNGNEIYRANMPGDQFPLFNQLATVAVSGPAEGIYFTAPPVEPLYLLAGLNVLAAEIHQSAPDSSDISFDLEMIGNGIFPNSPPTVAITSPTNGSSLAPGVIAIQATAADTEGLISLVEVFEGATKLGQATGGGPAYTFNWTNACAGTYAFTVRATDNEGLSAVSAAVVVTVARPPLVSPDATWKYFVNGAVPPPAGWATLGFNDSTWPGGAAQLGFGDMDETTVLNRTNANGSTNITFYFRHAFTVANPAALSSLNLSVMRDDGIVVYLNGGEIFRNNLPPGTPTPTTLSSTNATTFEENNFTFTASISPSLLGAGNNVLAAEVHQSAANSSDMSFALALGDTATNRPPTSVAITEPANPVLPAGASVTLRATATDNDGLVRRVEYYAGINLLGQATAAPYTFVWNGAPAGVHQLTARAYDNCDAVGFSTPVVVRVGAFTMIPPGAAWRYRDTGSDQGTVWRALNFANHFTWAEGNAQFGYGDGDEVTVLTKTNLVTGTTNITFYFRRLFPVLDPGVITGMVVRLLRDDGAIGYINGVEVFRSNMPTGAVNYLTPAVAAVEDGFLVETFGNNVLTPGTNVLAVEVHQQSITSSDVSFDLELIGLVGPFQPRLFIQAGPGTHTLFWPSAAAGYRLQYTDNLTPPASWLNQSGTPADDGVWRTLTLPMGPPARFYRLSQ